MGFSEQDSLQITVITGAVNIITTLIAITFVDKFGRKPLLLLGLGMTLTLGTLTSIFANAALDAFGIPNLTGSAGFTALIAANLYVFCFGFSWGPVVWVMLGEMFNNKLRAAALAISASVQWVVNFIISTSFATILWAWFCLRFVYNFRRYATLFPSFLSSFCSRKPKVLS